MSEKTVVVLGLGSGGLVAANELRKRLPRDYRVLGIDRSSEHVYQPGFLGILVGRRQPADITRDLSLLEEKGIEVLRADILTVDPGHRIVHTSAGEIPYAQAVVALGAELVPQTIPGLAEGGFSLYDMEGVTRLRPALEALRGGRIAIVVAGTPYKCTGAPYEAAFLLDNFFRRRRLRPLVEINIYTPEERPFPGMGHGIGSRMERMLRRRGVGFHAQSQVSAVDAGRRRILWENGDTVDYDLLIAIPPHRPPAAVGESALAGATGWVNVDRRTMATRFEGTYAVGDVTTVHLPAPGQTLPRAGVFAHFQAEVAAANLARDLTGSGRGKHYGGAGFCIMDVGRGRAAIAGGNFYASPTPKVIMTPPTRMARLGKVTFEKWWLWRWF